MKLTWWKALRFLYKIWLVKSSNVLANYKCFYKKKSDNIYFVYYWKSHHQGRPYINKYNKYVVLNLSLWSIKVYMNLINPVVKNYTISIIYILVGCVLQAIITAKLWTIMAIISCLKGVSSFVFFTPFNYKILNLKE